VVRISPKELAATAGHKVTGTSQYHYASRRSGWASFVRQVCRPHDADVIRVVRSPRTEWLDEKREEREARLRTAERRPSD
jgi:hypothetical protein